MYRYHVFPVRFVLYVLEIDFIINPNYQTLLKDLELGPTY